MPVKDKTKDSEAIAAKEKEEKAIEDKKKDVAKVVIQSLDLPTKEEAEVLVERAKKVGLPETASKEDIEKKEKEVKPTGGEEPKEMTDQEIIDTPDEDLNEEGLKLKKALIEQKELGEGDLIPKAKVDKRFKALTEEVKQLRIELAKKTEAAPDSDMKRLEGKSMEQLITLKQNIRKTLRDNNKKIAAGEEVDETRIDDLESLSDKIDETIRTFDQRFLLEQIALYDKEADVVTTGLQAELSGEELETACVEIKEIARGIYADYPKLHQSKEGQALALRLATGHWKVKKEFSVGKSKVGDLRRSRNKLLRKTTLDRNILKADKGRIRLDELKTKAGRGGTDEDRQRFVKEHPMFSIDQLIPDEFKEKK